MIEIRGAGIAGSYLAYLLSKDGYNVKVYEMRKKYDTKVCAGGVLPRVLKIINLSELEGIEIKTVDVEIGNRKIHYEGNLGKSIERRDLQIYIRDLAESEGARIIYGTAHKKFSKDAVKIIASGAKSKEILGIETHTNNVSIKPEGYYFKIYSLKKPVRYAWIFPKKDGFSVGVCGDRKWVIDHADIILNKLNAGGRKRGAYIGTYTGNPSLRVKDSWVIGDSAGLVDPLNYEGYTGAFYSALYLSKNLKSPDFTPLLNYLHTEWKLLNFASKHPAIASKFIKLWLRLVYSPKLREGRMNITPRI